MTNITQWDPFSELRSTMDNLFEQGFSRPWRFLSTSDNQASAFPVEIWETDEAVHLKAALPGVSPEQVDISVANGALTIRAETREETQQARTYHRREIAYGSFMRAFNLPTTVDADKAEARYEHGMLYLTLPKAEAVRPKQIKIGGVSGDGHLLN
jgi:HSP20 family protein